MTTDKDPTADSRLREMLDARRYTPNQPRDLTIPIPESSLRWLAREEENWARQQRNELPPIINADDFCAMDLTIPKWALIELEYQYRKGFLHGVSEATQLIYDLKSKGGYLRADEIANMLSNWCTELRKWKRGLWNEDPIKDQTTPDLKWEKWASMKKQCHERDGWACTQCGSTEKLEAHHIHSVQDGGTPELENLLTLCETCHRNL